MENTISAIGSGLSLSKVVLFGIVAVCLLASPFLVSVTYGSSSTSVNSKIISSNVHHQTLTSPNAQSGGDFGYSVALSRDTVVIGAPDESASGYSQAGHAYAFNVTTHALIQTFTSPDAQDEGWFGSSVALSGSTVVVGAYDESASGYSGAGHTYTFNAMTGKLIQTFTSPNPQSGGGFGYSVALSGTTLLVGAPDETASGYSDAGHAYTFNATTGSLIHSFTSPKAQAEGGFGSSLALTDSSLVVGASGESVSGYSYAGHAYSFNTKTDAVIHTFTSPQAQYFGQFGSSVALSGNTVVIGAPTENASGYSFAGHAYSFNVKTGKLIYTFTSPNAQSEGYFGWSIALNSMTIVVGALSETASGFQQAGHAYSFNAKTGKLIEIFTSPKAQELGFFGASVALSSTTLVVGAPGETALGYEHAGHVYIFY